eukprot:13937815-Alexandrium_andersonii.AAC.1
MRHGQPCIRLVQLSPLKSAGSSQSSCRAVAFGCIAADCLVERCWIVLDVGGWVELSVDGSWGTAEGPLALNERR